MAAENENSVRNMNKEEKLYLLHSELQKLTDNCLQNNISYLQIKKSADTLLKFERKGRNFSTNWLISVTAVSVFVCAIAIACYIEPSQRLLSSFGRHSLIKVLPLVDWTSLHGINCFIPNYFQEGENRPLLQEDCKNCSIVTNIDIVEMPTVEVIANNYLYKDIPVIVQGQAIKSTDIQDVIKLFLDDDVMRLFTCCSFESNMKMKRKDHRRFLEQIRHKQILQYYGHWENCFKEAAKLFRKLHSRPDVLPTSVELTASNWVFICNNYTENKQVSLPYEDQVVILIQLSGSLDIRLRPRDPCSENCTDIHASIPEGGAFFVTDFFYDIEYVTCTNGSSITVGLGGSLDI